MGRPGGLSEDHLIWFVLLLDWCFFVSKLSNRTNIRSKSRNIGHRRSLERPMGRSSLKVHQRRRETRTPNSFISLVLGIKDMHLPLPQQPTALTCTLNNGIHFVSTPECQLGRDSRIEQEFELWVSFFFSGLCAVLNLSWQD